MDTRKLVAAVQTRAVTQPKRPQVVRVPCGLRHGPSRRRFLTCEVGPCSAARYQVERLTISPSREEPGPYSIRIA